MPISRLQFRRANASSWASANPTLAAGELGFELDTGKFKIGNGITAWNALNYTFTENLEVTSGIDPVIGGMIF